MGLRAWLKRGLHILRYGVRRRSGRAFPDAMHIEPERLLQEVHPLRGVPVSAVLEENLRLVRRLWGSADALTVRRLTFPDAREAAVVYVDAFVDTQRVDEAVIRPLVDAIARRAVLPAGTAAVREIERRLVDGSAVEIIADFGDALAAMQRDAALIFIDGAGAALAFRALAPMYRQISEPLTESVIRGPREGFVEKIEVNIVQIRSYLRTPLLRAISQQLGRVSRTKVSVLYVEGIAPSTLVAAVRRRLGRIDIDGILESGYIEELIEDTSYTIFPQVLATERPDVVASQLLEGRVAILVDGTPFALVVPTTLWSLMQANEDYYHHWTVGTFTRLMRFGLALITIFLPSLYVAVVTFHPEMLPGPLLISIAAAREQVPFSTFGEVFVMELIFESLREAGVRLPRPVGQTISIVGALVIGQSAVQAGFVSAPVVIVVAFTGVASFAVPIFSIGISFRLVRFPMVILASSLGMFGIIVGVMALCLHLVSLRSFGTPYLAPVVPPRPREWKDIFIRAPMWAQRQRHRPGLGRPGGTRRQARRRDPSAGRSRAAQTAELEKSAAKGQSRWR